MAGIQTLDHVDRCRGGDILTLELSGISDPETLSRLMAPEPIWCGSTLIPILMRVSCSRGRELTRPEPTMYCSR